MRKFILLLTTATVIGATAALGAAPASAATVDSNFGDCPSENSVMTSNDWQANTKSSFTTNTGYLCAQEDHSGNQAIGADKTHTWSNTTNVDYYPQYNCYDTTSSSVTVSDAFIFGSGSFTATNWLAASLTEDNTRHWSAAMLWTLGAGTVTGFSNGCDVSDQVWNDPPDILKVTKFTATGMPDDGAAVAGQAYPITVTVSPSDATGSIGLMDIPQGTTTSTPVPVAGAKIQNGVAKFTWIPAQAGERTISLGYKGDDTHTGAITDDLKYTVTNGISLAITKITADMVAGTAVANVNVGPSTFGSYVAIIDLNQIDPSTGKPQVMGKAVASDGAASISFTYVPGTSHNYIASVVNASGVVIGQSYAFPWMAPTELTLSGPATQQLNFRYPFTLAMNPGVEPSTIKLYDGSNVIQNLSNTGGSSLTMYQTATALGSHSYYATYDGVTTNGKTTSAAGQSGNVSSTVGDGYTISLSVTSDAMYMNWTAKVTIKGTNGNVYNGPVSLYVSQNPKYPATGTPFAKLNATNGSVQYRWYSQYPTTYSMYAYISDANGGFLWSNSQTAKELRSRDASAPRTVTSTPVSKKHKNGHPSRGVTIAPGTYGNGYGVDTYNSLVEKSLKIRKSGSRSLITKCPVGSSLLHAEALTSGPLDDIKIVPTNTGATFTSPKANIGHKMRTQLLCRETTAGVRMTNNYGLGSVRDDQFRLIGAKATAFGGLGNDQAITLGRSSVLWGGPGMDRLTVHGTDSVALGGLGDDLLTARGKIRAKLEGGPGRDTLLGSTGPSVLLAADGTAGDRVICRSKSTRVVVDRGDTITGPCKANITWM